MSDAKVKRSAGKAAATHPKYIDMVKEAIGVLKERNGSSRQAICKNILATHPELSSDKMNIYVRNALKKGVASGDLTRPKGSSATGATGRFKLGDVKPATKPKAKKSAAKKPGAKKTGVKKPGAKKASVKKTGNKASGKKTTAKKSAKSPGKKTTTKGKKTTAGKKRAKTTTKKVGKKPAAKKNTSKKTAKSPKK